MIMNMKPQMEKGANLFSLPGEDQYLKLLIIIRCPTGAPIKQKMLYSSSKAALKDKIAGFNVEIQATEKWELEKDVIENKCKQFSK